MRSNARATPDDNSLLDGDGQDPRGTAGAWRPLVLVAMVVWVAATNASIFGPTINDGLSYRVLSSAAPGLPDQMIGSAYTGRWLPHYLIGLVANIPGLSLSTAYAIGLVVVVGCLLVTWHLLLSRMPLSTYVLSAGMIVLSPYAIRPYLADAWTFQDLVFVLGTSLCTLGLLRRSPATLLTGLVVAIAGRQSAMPVAIVAALWVLVDPAWRHWSLRARLGTAAGAIALVAMVYTAIQLTVAPFSKDFEPHIPGDTVVALLDELPTAAPALAAHLARTVVPLLVPFAVVIAALAVRRKRGLPWLSWPAFGCLALAAAIIGQPVAIDPGFPGFASNEQRLAALGLVPLVVAAGLLLTPVMPRRMSTAAATTLTLLLVVGSLHHLFTRVGPPNLEAFLALQLVVACGLGAVVWTLSRKPAGAQLERGAPRHHLDSS